MKLLLVGVEHRIQWIPQHTGPEWQQDLDQFAAHLRQYAVQARVDLLAEEFSEEALRRSNARDSVARSVAASLQIAHMFCDPDTNERRQLSIENDVQREAYWLARLRESAASVVIFVCGDSHVDSFRAKAEAAGHDAEVVSQNRWGYGWQLKE